MPGDLASTTGWSVAAAAERVGVSVSTLHTWERRYGLQPRGRTAGGHRRYTAADVALLQRVSRLVSSGVPTGAAAAAVQTANGRTDAGRRRKPGRLEDAGRDLQAAVDRLDVADAERIARQVVAGYGAVDAWTGVFAPVLQTLGQRFADTNGGVECEHAATAAIHSVLVAHARRHRGAARPDAPQVLLVAAPDEQHTLPLHALAAAMAERYLPALVLGTLPGDAVCAAVDRLRPAGLMLFARSRDRADLPLLRKVARATPLACAAGIGWPRTVSAPATTARDLPAALDLVIASAAPAR